jgi:hypothetical protein
MLLLSRNIAVGSLALLLVADTSVFLTLASAIFFNLKSSAD